MEKSIVFAVLSSLAMAAIFGVAYIFRPRPRTVQPVQQAPTPEGFAAAWNGGGIVPPSLLCTVQDPATGAAVPVFPRCAAIFTDTCAVRVSLSVLPDSPITVGSIASHEEDVRRALRVFFQVGMRVVGEPVLTDMCTCSMEFSPVQPACDSSGQILLGFDDADIPVYAPLIGEITAISGDDGRALAWARQCLPEVPYHATSDLELVKSAAAAAKDLPSAPSPVFVDIGDAVVRHGHSPYQPSNHNWVSPARFAVIERAQATTVDPAKWAIAPSQTLTRTGSVYELERAGRKTRFIPAWSY